MDSVLGSNGELVMAFESFVTEEMASTVATRGLSATVSMNQRKIAVTWLRNIASSPATVSSRSTKITVGPLAAETALSRRSSSLSGLKTSSSEISETVARAISAALCAVEDGGAIALCTELEAEPGSALKYVAQADDYDVAVHEVRRHRTEDALAAVQLLRALDRNQVYLLSDLDNDLVENLGLAPISDVAEVARLCQHHKSCIVLSNAQYAVPRVESVS